MKACGSQVLVLDFVGLLDSVYLLEKFLNFKFRFLTERLKTLRGLQQF